MKPKFKSGLAGRSLAMMMALTMMLSGSVSAFALDAGDLGGEPPSLSDGTGGELITDDGPGTLVGGLNIGGEDDVNNIQTGENSSESSSSSVPGEDEPSDEEGENKLPSSDRINSPDSEDNSNSEPELTDNPTGDSSSAPQIPVEDSEEEDDFLEQLYSLEWTDEDGNPIALVPPGVSLFSFNPGDTATVNSHSIPVNDYGMYSLVPAGNTPVLVNGCM